LFLQEGEIESCSTEPIRPTGQYLVPTITSSSTKFSSSRVIRQDGVWYPSNFMLFHANSVQNPTNRINSALRQLPLDERSDLPRQDIKPMLRSR